MSDVRLTAINPDDSQVYPVACNDKGELLLDPGTQPSGDLDVPGNLTVGGTGTFGGDIKITTTSDVITFNSDGSGNFQGDLTTGNFGDSTSTGALFSSTGAIFGRQQIGSGIIYLGLRGGTATSSVTADGNATYAGTVTASNINFSMTPDLVASIPAPLVDDGFAVSGQIDLLSELIKMKLQIRELNAFMQRSLQD